MGFVKNVAARVGGVAGGVLGKPAFGGKKKAPLSMVNSLPGGQRDQLQPTQPPSMIGGTKWLF